LIFQKLVKVTPILLTIFAIPLVFAEGGGGIDCPENSGVYSYLSGTATFNVNPFEGGEVGVLSCEYFTESEDENLEPLAQVTAIYHMSGELSQELTDEYGCGAILGEQYSSTYVSSDTHFASVAFSSPPLVEAAANIMTQIENQTLATLCTLTEEEINEGSTAESVKESVEEHEEIQDTAIEITIDVIEDKSIEEIIEQIEEEKEKIMIKISSETPKIVLPEWIKNNAEWWSSGQITNNDFSLGIEFMIKEGFIRVPTTEVVAQKSSEIPDWVKNNAGWWSEGMISDIDFVNGLQFLISNGIINVA